MDTGGGEGGKGGEGGGGRGEGEGPIIGLLLAVRCKTLTCSWWVSVKEGGEEEGKDFLFDLVTGSWRVYHCITECV